jgi:peroxiredoxin Q/BCP
MKEGDLVPDFELPDQTGTKRLLSDLLADGPVVLFFYPAAMTAGCTREACHFRDVAADFAAAGVQRSRSRPTAGGSRTSACRRTPSASPRCPG